MLPARQHSLAELGLQEGSPRVGPAELVLPALAGQEEAREEAQAQRGD